MGKMKNLWEGWIIYGKDEESMGRMKNLWEE